MSVKFGALVAPNGTMYGLDVKPLTVKSYLTYSLKRLNVDYIDLYQPGRIDLGIPVEETIGAIADMIKAGYIKNIGLTQVGTDTIRRAHTVHPITQVETDYSLFNRKIEKEILPTARELGIGVVAFGALAHGLLGDTWKNNKDNHYNSIIPLFSKENLDKNFLLVQALRKIASEKQMTLSQLSFAWLLSKGEDIIPLIGSTQRTNLLQSVKSIDFRLNESDIKRIEDAIPEHEIAGGSFPDMKFKNGMVVRE